MVFASHGLNAETKDQLKTQDLHLLRRQAEIELPQPLRQLGKKVIGFRLVLKQAHKVIRIPAR